MKAFTPWSRPGADRMGQTFKLGDWHLFRSGLGATSITAFCCGSGAVAEGRAQLPIYFAFCFEMTPVERMRMHVMTIEDLKGVVHSDPEIMGGTPVFAGTRVRFAESHRCTTLEGANPSTIFWKGFRPSSAHRPSPSSKSRSVEDAGDRGPCAFSLTNAWTGGWAAP